MPTVVITGTNRGLGFEYVKQYAADGWCVFAACRHPTSVDSLRLLAERSKGLVEVVAMDVTDLRSVKQAAAQIGDGAVDLLINSAGIAGKPHQKAGNVDYESWAEVFNVNTMGRCGSLKPSLVTSPAANANSPSPSRAAWARLPETHQVARSLIAVRRRP
jgi:NAD(P)-dependent dehydrogenase (short-subunit alcohol dehydrogenase family)